MEQFIKVGHRRFSQGQPHADLVRGKGARAVGDPNRASSEWRVGPELIGIDRLVLVSLEKVSRGSWRPCIGLLSQDEINTSSTPFVI